VLTKPSVLRIIVDFKSKVDGFFEIVFVCKWDL